MSIVNAPQQGWANPVLHSRIQTGVVSYQAEMRNLPVGSKTRLESTLHAVIVCPSLSHPSYDTEGKRKVEVDQSSIWVICKSGY